VKPIDVNGIGFTHPETALSPIRAVGVQLTAFSKKNKINDQSYRRQLMPITPS
jgi:hypothetical protein